MLSMELVDVKLLCEHMALDLSGMVRALNTEGWNP